MAIEETPHLAAHRAALAAWRSVPHEEQLVRIGSHAADRPAGPADGRVRVGIYCPCLLNGGAESWQLALARYTDRSRVSWRGACLVGGTSHVDDTVRSLLNAEMPVSAGLREAEKLAGQCDVILSWAEFDSGPIMARLERRPRMVYVAHVPGAAHPGRHPIPSSVDIHVAVSELALDAIPEGRRGEARVIWNAVDASRMAVTRSRDAMRESWGVPPGAPVAGYLGRLSREKDPHAMRRMVDHLPDGSDGRPAWHAVVVGAGAEVLEPHERLHVVGNDPAAGDVLNAFDVLVVASAYESFGLTIAEGLWAGIPVVTTPVGLAKLHPDLTRVVPVDADGPTLAAAVLAAREAGPMPGSREFARERLAPDRFGAEWTDLICGLAPERPAIMGHAATGVSPPSPSPDTIPLDHAIHLMKARRDCPHGSKPAGGCGCDDVLLCARGKGTGGLASRAECYLCIEKND